MNGSLYLIPNTLGENAPEEVIPGMVLELIHKIDTYVVEEIKTARRYLSRAGLKGQIEDLKFYQLDKHTPMDVVSTYIELFKGGKDVGLISEAGLPAVADPGSNLVALCHQNGIKVIPLSGPSSLMMALMASGMNGQSFAFNGYLPINSDDRKKALKSLEGTSAKLDQSEIFIETPYRNDKMLDDILSSCSDQTRLCIAVNVTMPDEFICTKKIAEWKKHKEKTNTEIGKRPCVFIIHAAKLNANNHNKKYHNSSKKKRF